MQGYVLGWLPSPDILRNYSASGARQVIWLIMNQFEWKMGKFYYGHT